MTIQSIPSRKHTPGIVLALEIALLLLLSCAPTAVQPSQLSTATEPPPASEPQSPAAPNLADFWRGAASFELEIADTGLPMGESDTHLAPDGRTLWSYIHASHPSAGVLDQCGDPVAFPGCVVIFASHDQGYTFAALEPDSEAAAAHPEAITCQIPCLACPCDSRRDHIDQQQYPRIAAYPAPHRDHSPDDPTDHKPTTWLMVYEYRANVLLRRSHDGLNWSRAEEIPLTGIWQSWLMPCPARGAIGEHPFSPRHYDCLVGSPPGLYIDAPPDSHAPPEVYVFVGLGQNPSAMGCYRGPIHAPAALYRQCASNPLFVGRAHYGPQDDTGPDTNPFFDFRTISSADILQVEGEFYMLYEGVRGPEAGAAGDTQFALGLARTVAGALDGPWETFAGNPILVDNPGNVGLGHADLLVLDGVTYLYTSLDGATRSRLRLVWRSP